MVRDAGEWNHVTAAGGFYEQPLKQTSPIQLLRLTLEAPGHRFPEISAGRQRFTIRFYHQDSPAARAVQIDDDIEFDLACCGL